MKIVFFGTPFFSAEILKYLIDQGLEIVAVVTKVDKPQGRNLRLVESAVKRVVLNQKVPIKLFQPKKIATDEFISVMKIIDADLFVTVAFGQIFPKELLDMPKYGCINVHTSLLPKYRGAAPIERAIMEGEKETGVTIMYMVEALDAGDILAVEKVPIHNDMTAKELTIELCKASKPLLVNTIKSLFDGTASRIKQDESKVTYAKKIKPEDGYIDFSCSASKTYNIIRAVTPKPGAWCRAYIRGKEVRLKLLKAHVLENEGEVGEILEYGPKKIAVACNGGSIAIDELQLEGKKATLASEFVKGYSSKDFSLRPKAS